MKFNPTRLSIARKRAMLTKKALAEALNVERHTVMRWELDEPACLVSDPTPENLAALTRILGFPKEFFYGDDVEETDGETTSFRSQKAMSARARDAALAAGQIGVMIWNWVFERFDLPEVKILSLGEIASPETAAQMLRQSWALGEKPISNMIQLLEAKGVRVCSLAENTQHVNAYSFWKDGTPYVFLNNFKSAECSRFDAAHELAHLVLHQDGRVKGRLAEDQANQFAAAFLMPRADVVATLPRLVTLPVLLCAKARWKVSVGALNYRAHKLGITSEWRNRDLCIEISAKGYQKCEPQGIERERSVVWEKILRALWQEGTTQEDIARDLHLPVREVNDLLFGIIGQTTTPAPTGRKLSLIENASPEAIA